MAEQTLDGLAAGIARRYGYYATGTATAGSTTTLTDTNTLIQPANAWNNAYVRFLSGANAGQERLVTSYAAGVLTFAAVNTTIAAGVTYEVGPLQRTYIVQAVQDAIDRAGENWMAVKDDATGTFTPGTQEYALPADTVSVLGVYIWVLPNSNSAGHWEPLGNYEVLGTPGARKLVMRGWGNYPTIEPNTVTYQRRIRYIAMPTLMSGASDRLGLGEIAERQALAFIGEYALAILNEMGFEHNRTGEQARAHLTASTQHYQKAMQIMAERTTRREMRYMRSAAPGRQM